MENLLLRRGANKSLTSLGVNIRSPSLVGCVDEQVPLGGKMFMWKFFNRSLCLKQVWVPNSSAQYTEFVKETTDALRKECMHDVFGRLPMDTV